MLRISNSFFGGWLGAIVLLLGWGLANAITPTVAVGSAHTLVLRSNGALLGFGDDTSGQLGLGRLTQSSTAVQVVDVTLGSQVAAGAMHTLVARSDGTVWAWGKNDLGQLGRRAVALQSKPAAVQGLTGVSAVAAGGSHSLELRTDGTVWAGGDNSSGQLGDDLSPFRNTPLPVAGLSDVAAIATANDISACHVVAVKKDGTVWAWGENGSGELGDGTTLSRSRPAQVAGLTAVIALAAGGGGHTLAVRRDGTVWAWGKNSDGQLGDGTSVTSLRPVQVKDLAGVTAVAAGYAYSMALRSDGTVWTWGWNAWGMLGDGTDTDHQLPQQVPGLKGIVAITAGPTHAFALTREGVVWAWGENGRGQLGDSSMVERWSPVMTRNLSGVVMVAAGDYPSHSLAVRQDGTVWAWGDNSAGQLGDGSAPTRSAPTAVPGMTDVAAVSTANDFIASHTLALKQDGTVWAWGENQAGELGDGTTKTRSTPAQVPGLTDVIAIATAGGASDAGGGNSAALKRDGSVWEWGNNFFGQLGDGTTSSRLTPAQVPGMHGVAAVSGGYGNFLTLKVDGTVWYLAPGGGSQVEGLSAVIGISAGTNHSLAVKSDGTVWAWGSNGFGALGDGTTIGRSTPVQVLGLTDAVAVAAGDYHSLALRRGGGVVAWGDNSAGQLGDGTFSERHIPVKVIGVSKVKTIGAGGSHSVAVSVDGTVLAWGANESGQRGDGTLATSVYPAPAVNPAVDGYLNLLGDTPNRTSPSQSIPFFVDTLGAVGKTAATVTATIKYNAADVGKVASVYVFASVPLAALGTSPASTPYSARHPQRGAQVNGFACVSLSVSGESLNINSQTVPFLTNVENDFSSTLSILNNTATNTLKGAEIYVTYSGSGSNTPDTGQLVTVATVPGALPGDACNVATPIDVVLSVDSGWNLLGHPVKQTISAAEKFGDASKITSVWKWDADAATWQFYAPQLDSLALASYAASQGYGVLTEINGGDGYWVHAKSKGDLGTVSGPAITPLRSSSLASGWNLVSTASTITAKDFNLSLSTTPPTAGQVPINMESLWAWDPAQSRWYFYSPNLEAQGGSALASYIKSQSYVDFDSNAKTLGNGVGFWVKRP
jgi:alpha-tubulin suppressor-like RCC1 family protein